VSLAWRAYRGAVRALGAVLPAARAFVPPQERETWDERLGRTTLPQPADAWVHAASMGEATAVRPLVAELAAAAPRAGFLLTAGTLGGRARLVGAGSPVAMAPLDSPQATRRFFDGVRPRRLLLLETELWPHWLLEARARAVPVAVVSARLSADSVAGYARLGSELRELVAGLAAVLCQSAADLERWRALGARPEASVVTGNLKDDGLPVSAPDRAAARARLGVDAARPLLVLGSLRPGEPAALARAWRAVPSAVRAGWQVVAVPRHPRASVELRAEAERSGQAVHVGAGGPPEAWRWEDQLGVLAGWYGVADVAFVGGSLAPWGGHNPLEPAACGAAVLMGPHHESQRDAAEALLSGGGLRVVEDEADAAVALTQLLADEPARAAAARAGLAVVAARRGVARRTVAQLVERGLWPA
jgi:3-deoxy-D-manno-octulosonic-acid transferase